MAISPRSRRAIGRFFLLAMVGTHAFFLWSVRGRIQKGDPDFTVYYTAGKILREGRGRQLYDAHVQEAVQREFATNSDIRRGPLPYIHPPLEALLFLPLTFLPYGKAFVLWNVLNLGMLFAIARLVRRDLSALQQVSIWEWVLALLAFFPVFANFLQGQDAILLLLAFVLGFRALEHNAEFIAGCWLGLTVFKYHFAIPLVVILAVWKGRRLAAGFALTASAAVVISLAIVGWHGALQYPAYAWYIATVPGHGQTPLGLMPNLLGFATGWSFLEDFGFMRWAAIVVSAGLLIAVACMRDLARGPNQGPNNDPRLFRLSFACAVVAAVLVSYMANAHDLSLLVLPLALVADHCVAGWSERQVRALLVPVAPLLVSPIWIFLWMWWGKLNLVVILLLWWVYAMRREMLRLTVSGVRAAAPVTSSP
jgi:glycosyl transferase family 87